MRLLNVIIALLLLSFAVPDGFSATDSASPAVAPVSTVPSVPLGLAMVANSPDSITLGWYRSPNNDATSYNVYVSSKPDGVFKRFATVTERTVTHSKLSEDTAYFYKVSAINADGESALSHVESGFTFKPCEPAPFPVRIAKNMCVSLGATIVSSTTPSMGKLSNLVDGSDTTSCGFSGACEVKIKLNTAPSIADADYLLLNFRTDNSGKGYAYNINWRSLKNYVITESVDSTTGLDGTWREVLSGSNGYLDGVIVIPNHKPKWIGIRNSDGFQLCRLDVFRSAPAGFRNDYWIFTGDSLVVQDFGGGTPSPRFSDLVRQQHPDRYPIIVNSSQGGEVMMNTRGRLKNSMPSLSPPNGTAIPTGTIVCFESGFNDIGVGGGVWMGPKIIKGLSEAQEVCTSNGLLMVPTRVEYSTSYLNKETMEPAKYNIFVNTLAVNLAGVDQFCRAAAPYACDPITQLPYADYWTYTRKNYATALSPKDGVHHTEAGSDGINHLWVEVADKMIYSKQQ